ncbi:MAG: hypothetical protein FWE16_03325 [Firmicutes bacterium]|nr:hypothetical protein [Bacillota bacterium]
MNNKISFSAIGSFSFGMAAKDVPLPTPDPFPSHKADCGIGLIHNIARTSAR